MLDADLKALLAKSEPAEIRAMLANRLVASYQQLSNKDSLLEDGASVRFVLLGRLMRSFPEDEMKELLGTEAGRKFLLGVACDDTLLKACFGYDLSGLPEPVWPKRTLATWASIWGAQSVVERQKYGVMGAACAYALGGSRVRNYNDKLNSPREVYDWMKASTESANFVVSPAVLTFDELCLLAVVPRSVEEMEYLRKTTSPKKSRWGELASNCWRVRYTLLDKDGVSIHDPAFYKGHPATVDVLEKMGGVCGAISKFGVAACRSRGVPATAVGQPGHCAFIWLSSDFKWQLTNDVFGWSKTVGTGEGCGGVQMLSPWGVEANWLRVVERLRLRPEALRAELLMAAADQLGGAAQSKLLMQASAECPIHPSVWRRLLAVVPAGERPKLVESAKKALAGYPSEVAAWACAR